MIDASKNISLESLEQSLMMEERRIFSLQHFEFRRAREQMETLERANLLIQEKEISMQEILRTISELETMASEREGHLQSLVKMVEDQEESLKTRDEKIHELEGSLEAFK
ncbi:hypothetical protein Adt_18664 [Abeliophyllum distichum]|uniref:Uncharacterized protein n=1 Tax=Abeliophyllum distichum TaxID=126358 RepID=A0ABD1TK16_9LAMI